MPSVFPCKIHFIMPLRTRIQHTSANANMVIAIDSTVLLLPIRSSSAASLCTKTNPSIVSWTICLPPELSSRYSSVHSAPILFSQVDRSFPLLILPGTPNDRPGYGVDTRYLFPPIYSASAALEHDSIFSNLPAAVYVSCEYECISRLTKIIIVSMHSAKMIITTHNLRVLFPSWFCCGFSTISLL